MNKTKIILLSSVLTLSVVGVGLYIGAQKEIVGTGEIHFQYPADFSDDRILVGASHNIFVGKVIKQVGNKSIGAAPETQFEVEVIDNIKGDLKGVVVVNQMGGYMDGILYVIHDDIVIPGEEKKNTLLNSGETYLFASRFNENENWHVLNSHPNATKLISKDSNLTIAELKNLAKNDEKVIKFREAYKNEILLDVDVKNNNTRNSYESLQENK